MSSLFQGLVDPATGTVIFNPLTPDTAKMRGMFVGQVGPPFDIFSAEGKPAESFGAGGLSFDAFGALIVTNAAPENPTQLPGGMLADAAGALHITVDPPDLIYQGVALTNAGVVCVFVPP